MVILEIKRHLRLEDDRKEAKTCNIASATFAKDACILLLMFGRISGNWFAFFANQRDS